MAELKPCPFCGGVAFADRFMQPKEEWRIMCTSCPTRFGRHAGLSKKEAIKAWNRRTKIEVNFYDKEETYTNCTVQVLTNTVTGDVSVGWWKNGGKEDASEA